MWLLAPFLPLLCIGVWAIAECNARPGPGAWRACNLLRMDVFLLCDYTRSGGQDGVSEEIRVVFAIAVDRHRQLPLTQGMGCAASASPR